MGEYTIGEAIRSFLKKSNLKGPISSLEVKEVWEKIMGKTIAQYTDNIEIYKGTLFISTKVGPLKSELLQQKAQIIDRINEELGDRIIKSVIIK